MILSIFSLFLNNNYHATDELLMLVDFTIGITKFFLELMNVKLGSIFYWLVNKLELEIVCLGLR